MLLDPNDYTYEYFQQSRGHDGESGAIYLGTPIRTGLVPILIKSSRISEAINEYVGCNLGQKMGLNTPRAWLFKPENRKPIKGIRFDRAVAIEYLEGLKDCAGSYAEALYEQTMNAIMLHKLLGEDDRCSFGWYKEKLYTFDFAESLYPQCFHEKGPELNPLCRAPLDNGFLFYRHVIYAEEIDSRRRLLKYVQDLEIPGVTSERIVSIYYDFKNRFLEYYNPNGHAELVEEIRTVFSSDAAEILTLLIDGMQQVLVAF